MKSKSKSLTVTHPEIASQADGWDPSAFTAASKKKVNWKCTFGHVTSASINNRVKSLGCPICSGHYVLEGWNDLNTTHPYLAKEADGWDPKKITARSSKSLGWRCPEGHFWKTRISRRLAGNNCSICKKENYKGIPLSDSHPNLVKEAYNWDPTIYISDRKEKVLWRCGKNHVWEATIKDRKSGRGCPECNKGKGGKKVTTGFNDLQTLFPELCLQAHGWEPKNFLPGSNKRMQWICTEGHVWSAGIHQRVSTGSGCPFCAGQRVIEGKNDLQSLFPELAKQAYEWDPKLYAAFSDHKMKWECPAGHLYVSPISSRTSGGNGCHYCSGQKVLAGFNDLQTTNPQIAAKAFDWDPTTVNGGSEKKKNWICDHGHIWHAAVKDLVFKENGCPYCSGRLAIVGINDLLTLDPDLAAQADGWDPSKYKVQSSSKKMKWKCPEGHIWLATIASRTVSSSTGRGCPSCAQTGFDPTLPGWLYLMIHKNERMLQIGISNFPEERTNRHRKKGWELLDLRGPLEGDVARAWETSILQMLAKREVQFGYPKNHKIVGRNLDRSARNESWMQEGLNVNSIKELMSLVVEIEDSH